MRESWPAGFYGDCAAVKAKTWTAIEAPPAALEKMEGFSGGFQWGPETLCASRSGGAGRLFLRPQGSSDTIPIEPNQYTDGKYSLRVISPVYEVWSEEDCDVAIVIVMTKWTPYLSNNNAAAVEYLAAHKAARKRAGIDDYPYFGCAACGTPTLQRCSCCKSAHYCSRECQKSAWLVHKLECGAAWSAEESDQQASRFTYDIPFAMFPEPGGPHGSLNLSKREERGGEAA